MNYLGKLKVLNLGNIQPQKCTEQTNLKKKSPELPVSTWLKLSLDPPPPRRLQPSWPHTHSYRSSQPPTPTPSPWLAFGIEVYNKKKKILKNNYINITTWQSLASLAEPYMIFSKWSDLEEWKLFFSWFFPKSMPSKVKILPGVPLARHTHHWSPLALTWKATFCPHQGEAAGPTRPRKGPGFELTAGEFR